MPRNILRKALFVALEVIVMFLCAMGVKQSAEKATLHSPDLIDPHMRDGVITVSRDDGQLKAGDQLRAIDGKTLYRINDVEFILDGKRIGDVVMLSIMRNGLETEVREQLVPYYGSFDVLAQLLAAVACLFIGLFVLSNRPDDPIAVRFNGLCMSIACLVCFTHGYYQTEPMGIGYLLRILFPAMYVLTGAYLLDFCLRYVAPSRRPGTFLLAVLYALPLAITAAGIAFALRALGAENLLEAIPYYLTVSAAKGLLILLALLAMSVVSWNFLRTNDRLTRRRLLWVLGSVGFSVAWYVFLWQIPTSIVIRNIVPVEYHPLLEAGAFPESGVLIALVLSSVGLAIGVVRFRLFNIEVLVRTGIVTFLLLLTLLFIYVLAMLIVLKSLSPHEHIMFITASALVTAMLIIAVLPVRKLVRYVVDKYMFRVEYDYLTSQKKLIDGISHSLGMDSLARVLVEDLAALLRCERAQLLMRMSEHSFKPLLGRGVRRTQRMLVTLHSHRFYGLDAPMYDLGAYCEPATEVPKLEISGARRLGFAVAVLLRNESGELIGLLALGRKTGFAPFSVEDVELIGKIAPLAIAQIDKILLQQRLTVEMHESNRLRELNRMKSHFVSGVSHDLKTPLTAIRMYTEMIAMRHAEVDEETGKYLAVIDGECRRLSKLVDNVLDFSRIEQGKRQYRMQAADLVALVQETLDAMRYQFDINGFTSELIHRCTSCRVLIDAQAIQDAIINLLSNAIKYSGDARHISVEISRDEFSGRIAVRDYGNGIDPEDMPNLFEPFYRSHADHVQRQGGVGLGLSLVRHIMTAHGGAIDIQSAPGRGSTFTLIIPIQEAA
jgi:signal transduction histidine kinase